MSNVEIAIGRGSLNLSGLLITGNRLDPLSTTADGVGEPATMPRTKYADPSPYVAGSLPTASVLEHSNLPLKVKAAATSSGLLADLVEELRTAIGQFTFVTTVTIRDVSRTWTCDPGSMTLTNGAREPGDLERLVEYYTVTIPVYPIPGGL